MLFLIIGICLVIGVAYAYRENIRQFFKDSETLFLAFIQAVTGAVSGILSFIDFAPLVSLANDVGFTKQQAIALSVVLIIQGFIMWIARKARDPEMK